jgi:hypothetical protein
LIFHEELVRHRLNGSFGLIGDRQTQLLDKLLYPEIIIGERQDEPRHR